MFTTLPYFVKHSLISSGLARSGKLPTYIFTPEIGIVFFLFVLLEFEELMFLAMIRKARLFKFSAGPTNTDVVNPYKGDPCRSRDKN